MGVFGFLVLPIFIICDQGGLYPGSLDPIVTLTFGSGGGADPSGNTSSLVDDGGEDEAGGGLTSRHFYLRSIGDTRVLFYSLFCIVTW